MIERMHVTVTLAAAARKPAAVAWLLMMIAWGAPSPSAAVPGDPIQAIENDYRKGVLTLDEKVLLQITAIKTPDRLPPPYQLFDPSTGKTASRNATLAIREAVLNWELLSDWTRLAFREAFARPSTAYSYYSQSGFFKLHYDLTGTHQVPSTDDDSSGVPDFVEKCAAYCDTTLERHIEMGYLLPPSDGGLGGDTAYDIYFENMGYYGYAMPEGPGPAPWNDYFSYVVLNSDFIGFPPNNDPEGNQYGAAKVTVAHEFHHAVQFAYDISEGTWFVELDATCMEDIIFNQTDDNYNYLDSFFYVPERSLLENSDHCYSSFIWGLYLAQAFDTSLLAAIWEGARFNTVFNTLSDTLVQRYGWTQDSAFAEFTVWNYITGSRDDGLHHEEAGNYPLVKVGRTHTVYPTNSQTAPSAPAGYGANYIEFYPPAGIGSLRLTFNGNASRQWAAYLIKSISTSTHEFEKIELDTVTQGGDIEVLDFQSYYRVTLVAANISEFSSPASFAYSAEIHLPYSVASAVLTADSAVYSGGSRDFIYQVTNTSPLYDVFDISFWDDAGWITPGTVDKAISPGSDSLFAIQVQPPQGTALLTIAHLYFAVQSRGDPTVADTQTAIAVTVLQRGDVDFSGRVDVADVTALVGYLFLGGPPPAPVVEAADYDCTTEINIADLTSLVTYLFAGANPCACNPY